MAAPVDRTAAFRALHETGCFVIPNPWDVGSARYLEMLGFKALATTSSGFAWTLGRSDTRVTIDEVLAHLAAIAGSVEIPVNADFEGGYAIEPDGVAANVTRVSDRPSVQANPELVVARALKPSISRYRALPTSHGLGMTKQPVSCSARKAPVRSAGAAIS